jgi:archaemetzincin
MPGVSRRVGVREVLGAVALLGVACGDAGAITEAVAPTAKTKPAAPPAAGPGELRYHRALTGDLSSVPEATRRAFAITDAFAAMPEVQPGDWLDGHPESGQTVGQWLASSPNAVASPRTVIYLQPIGALPAERGPTIDELVAHAHVYFGLEVRTLPTLALDELKADRRRHDGVTQIDASDALDALERSLPADAYCLIALTLQDLYPDASYNYVFGLARLDDRVGIFSFARYHPRFFDPRATVARDVVVRRALKVMTHEVGHMFGIEHCTFFACNLNGSNNLDELDREPAHLCPVCLRKLHLAVGFEPRRRYEALQDSYTDLGLYPEARWVQQRLDELAPSRPY